MHSQIVGGGELAGPNKDSKFTVFILEGEKRGVGRPEFAGRKVFLFNLASKKTGVLFFALKV